MIAGKKYFMDAINSIPPEISKYVDMRYDRQASVITTVKQATWFYNL